MEVKIEDYLSHEEIKEIVKDSIKVYVRDIIGGGSTTEYGFIRKLAKELAKEGCQELIPNFEEIINEHLKEEIKNIKLENLFWQSFGWKSEGNKLLNKLLAQNEDLISAKIKEIFK